MFTAYSEVCATDVSNITHLRDAPTKRRGYSVAYKTGYGQAYVEA